MARLQYSINVTLDGCCDHTAIVPPEMHQFWSDGVGWAKRAELWTKRLVAPLPGSVPWARTAAQ